MKNKKILGALAALCMGVILCVSSVFAINYWYTITNNSGENNVTLGNALEITMTDAAEDYKYLYPGGFVEFNTINVVGMKEWNWKVGRPDFEQDANITNIELPKFALVVKEVTAEGVADEDKAEFLSLFKLYQDENVTNDGDTFALVNVIANDLVILDDIQQYGDASGNFDFKLRLAFDENANAKYADASIKFTIEVRAYLGNAAADGTLTTTEALGADTDDTTVGTKPTDAQQTAKDPTKA